MSQKTMINDLTQGAVTKRLLIFAYPLALSNILQVVYNLVDMIIVGQFVGSTGLSGVSIGSELMSLCTFICMGFASAGQIMISQYVGKGDGESIKKCIGTMFTFILAMSIVLTVVPNLLLDPILRLMNTPEEAYQHARDYSFVCFCGMFFIFGYNIVSSILRGMGDSKRPFIFIAVASVVNVVLDLLFVGPMEMGALGAALATVIGQAVSFVGSVIYLYKKRESFGFDFKLKSFAIDPVNLKALIKLGLPLALQHSAISISMMFVNASINSFGVVASAVTGVGNKLRSVMSIVTQAVGTASSTMIGQNIGAGKTDRVKTVVRTALVLDMVACVVFSAVFLIWPEAIFGLFTDDPEVLAWAPKHMLVVVVAFLSFATMSPFNALINGIGHSSLSFVIGIMDGVVARVGLAVLLGSILGFGIEGYWYGNALAGFVTSILASAYYFSGKWKTRKLIINR